MKIVAALLAAALTGAYVLAVQSRRHYLWGVAGFVALVMGFVLVATLAPSLRTGVLSGYMIGLAAGALAVTLRRRRKKADG